MSQQSKKADLNTAVTLYTKRLLHALTEGNPVEQEEIDALNEMREAAGMKPLAIAITTQGKAPSQKAPQPERKQPQSERKPSGQQYTRQQDAEADPENVSMVPLSVGGNRTNAHLMPDNAQWTNRFMIRSESSNRLYTIAQNKNRRYWGCNCPGWISRRNCKHLKALGLPGNEAPYEAKLNKGASAKANIFPVRFAGEEYSELAHVLAAELIHSDNELSKLMEQVPEIQGEAHIEGPEAGPSNDELHENSHPSDGAEGAPVFDGDLKSPERQNTNAIREALETQVEMEVGKPIEQKQEEVAMQEKVQDAALAQGAGSLAGSPAATQEVSAKPGTQIIINVGSKAAAKEVKCAKCGKAVDTKSEGHESGNKWYCDKCSKQAAKKVAYVKHCPGHKNSKGESAEWCIYSHETGKIISSEKSEGAAKQQLQNMHAHSASDEGGAWSISGVTPNKETNDDVNKALKRMMAAYVTPEDLTSAGRAVMQRIKSKPELVFKYGFDQVLEAVYESTAHLGDLEEIGSSDVSIWLHNVEQNLEKYGKTGAEGIGGENQNGATNDGAGGMFGGTDLEGPDFKVGFTFRGAEREASFSTLKEAHSFIKSASAKFGKIAGDWTMKCPSCGESATKQNREDSYRCPKCGWDSHTAAPKKASAKTAVVKQVAPDPNFVEAMVNAVLIDHGARAMEMQIPLTRLVSIIKTKIKKVTRGNTSTISIYIPENDTEYVMQLPKDQAEQGNYKYQPHTAAADPAKRNLVLELLKGGRHLSTGEIEKALGGGKYTNMAWGVLQELAHEGLVAHKQMRWSLKASKTADRTIMPQETLKQTPGAYNYDRSLSMQTKPIAEDPKGAPSWVTGSKKSFRIKSAEPLPSSFSIATRTSQGHPLAGEAGIKTIAEELNGIYATLKQIDPQGFKDSFELQLPSRMMDIAKKHGVQMEHDPSDNTYTFYDAAGASTKGQKHEELRGINPHTGDPARPEAFDHHQQGADKTAYPRKKQMPTKAERELGSKALRLELDAQNQGAVGIAWANEGLYGVHLADETHPQEEVRRLVKEAIANGANPQIMFMEQNDADSTECLICHELFAEPSSDEDDWTRNYDEERDHKSYTTSSLKTATIRITSAQPMPSKGSPEWHQLQVAIGSLKAPDAMLGVMGGPSKEEAHRILAQHGLRWDEADYMAGGKGIKKAGDGMAKTVESEKEAGFNFFFPGQVLKEFYPEVQHEIVDYPNANNQPMGLESPEIVGDGEHELEGVLDSALDTNIIEMIQLPADVGEVEPLAMAAADYSSTSPAGGMGIGRDGKPEVLEGAPLRKENDIRGYMFTDEFYGQYEGIPGAAMNVASKTAAEGDDKQQFSLFLKKVCGEIAATMVAAFKVTSRPLLDKVPGIGEIQLDVMEQGTGTTMPAGQTTQGGRVKYLMSKLNDSDIKQAINDAWAQAAVWNDNAEGGFVYEVFVRPETIDTDSLQMKYKFVCGTRE